LTGDEFLGEWSATFIMTFVSYFIPWIIGMVSEMEKWDFAAQVLRADLLKNFYTMMANMGFFMLVCF